MRRRHLIPVLSAASALAALAAPAAAAAPTTHNWVENAYTTHVLAQSYPATAAWAYNRPGSYGTGSSTTADPVMDGYATTPVLRYTSEAQLAAAVNGHVIPSATWPAGSWVEYDNEEWSATPTAEQQAPAKYMALFGQVAHAAGFKVLMTPARDLGNVDTECPKTSGQNLDAWYLACDIAGHAAAASDGVVVQTQVDTLNIAAYDSLFNGAQAQAAAANPAAWVDAELSDTYGTPAQAYAAGSSVAPAGFFIHCANSDVSWENSTLTLFQSNGW